MWLTMTCDLLIGWRNKEPAWDLIGQDNHWEVPKRLRINTQNTLLNWLKNFSSRAWMLRPLGPLSLSLSGKMNSLSLQLWTTPSQLLPWWEEKPPRLFTSFYYFTFCLFSFRWVRVLSYVCQRKPAQNSAGPATSQRPLQRLLNFKPISDFGETLSRKDGGQREIFKQKNNASTNPGFLL